MRLSGLVIALILFFSTTLLAQHSSGVGGSSSGGSSSGGSSRGSSASSGSYSSSGSSHVNSAGSHGSSRGSGSTSSSSVRTDRGKASSSGHDRSSNVKPEKKSFFAFLRHRKPPPKSSLETDAKRPIRCKKGQTCTVCTAGENRNAAGVCISQAQVLPCPPAQVWNGFACGARYSVNDCGALAAQLAQQERQMRSARTAQQPNCSLDSVSQECADLQGQSGRESLRYRLLQEQYDQCMARSGSYAFRRTSLLDAP